MSKHYQAAAEIIKGAIASINAILTDPEDEMHRLKLSQSLQREADYLLLVTGAGDVADNTGTVLGPATTIGGKPISKIPKITQRDLRPSDDKVLQLQEDVESALVYFGPDSDSGGILANIPDLIIRGVARKAGLQVTKQKPEILTVEFIDQIKEAVAKLPKRIETNVTLTDEDVERLAEAITRPVSPADVATTDDLEAHEFAADSTQELIDMVKAIDSEPKQEAKPDTKKKTGK